ncbi:MAG: hypothetical protein Fur0042_09470 [Cyanophyceae cyanobacterium]
MGVMIMAFSKDSRAIGYGATGGTGPQDRSIGPFDNEGCGGTYLFGGKGGGSGDLDRGTWGLY